jgi:hypothetical protein
LAARDAGLSFVFEDSELYSAWGELRGADGLPLADVVKKRDLDGEPGRVNRSAPQKPFEEQIEKLFDSETAEVARIKHCWTKHREIGDFTLNQGAPATAQEGTHAFSRNSENFFLALEADSSLKVGGQRQQGLFERLSQHSISVSQEILIA